MLTTHERNQVAKAVIRAALRQKQEATEDMLNQAMEWALGARVDGAILELVLEGHADIWFDGDTNPSFRLTEQGQAAAADLIEQIGDNDSE